MVQMQTMQKVISIKKKTMPLKRKIMERICLGQTIFRSTREEIFSINSFYPETN